METAPLAFTWDGEAMVPRHPRLADKAFAVGEIYVLVEHHDRSQASHRQYFAAIRDAHDNLPEDLAEQFATPDHLRKWALCKAGYADERSIVCASKAEAQRMAAFLRPMDSFAVVTVREAMVRVYTAQSQSLKAMGKQAFQDSKQKVLDILDGLVGVERGTLQREAGRAA